MLLAEKLLLLALDDEKGKVVFSAQMSYAYGIAGALLLELSTKERIELDGKKLAVINPQPTGDPLLDQVLQLLKESKPRTISAWISRLQGNRKLRALDQLRSRAVSNHWLRHESKKILWIFPSHQYVATADGMKVERDILETVRRVALNDREEVDRETGLLISLIHATRLQKVVFTKDERKQAQRRLKEISKNEQYGKAVSETVAAVEAAIIAAIAAGGAAAASTSSSS